MFEAIAVLLAGVAIAAYFERKALKAELVAEKQKTVEAGNKFLLALRTQEQKWKAELVSQVAQVTAQAKADAEKLAVSAVQKVL